ncbi:MAG: glycerate kinase [Verrucomicrobia bacterium]|nr:glycerate kinase [Verrucomicrobiota bacterium]
MPALSFLIAPDKFKGSLTAQQAARAMARGVRDALPSARIEMIPLADGGDGTAELLRRALRARAMQATVHDPLGRKTRAAWGLHGSTAYLDFASASGLRLVLPEHRNPLKTTSRGVGELMNEAVRYGACRLTLGVGGSATVDGGVGAMRALGIRFLDKHGAEIPEGGGGLSLLHRVDLGSCVWKTREIEVLILADVRNPLLGKNGAAAVFGPQKGATAAMLPQLEIGLERLNRIIGNLQGRSLARLPSGGAAGGVVAGFLGILGNVDGVCVRVTPGIDHVLSVLGVGAAVQRADWVLTGEGWLDAQTAHGKTIDGLSRLCRRFWKPVLAFAGKVSVSPRQARTLGLTAAFSIAPGPCATEESLHEAAPWLRAAVANVARHIDSERFHVHLSKSNLPR